MTAPHDDSVTLVTGAGGFLGSRVLQRLVSSGHKRIRCLVRPGTSPESILRDIPEEAQGAVTLYPVSFNDAQGLQQAFQGVGLVHHIAAAKTGSVPSLFASTVVGSDNLYRAAVNASVRRFVLVSSISVFQTAQLKKHTLIDEECPIESRPQDRDGYAFSKQRQETLAWEYHRNDGLPLVVIRPGVIIGPGTGLLHSRIGLGVWRYFLHLGGRCPLPYTFVENCADAVVLAGEVEGIEGESFCVIDDGLPTSSQVLRRYRRNVSTLRVVRVPYPMLMLMAKFNAFYTDRTRGHLPAFLTPYKVRSLWRPYRYLNTKAKSATGDGPPRSTLMKRSA